MIRSPMIAWNSDLLDEELCQERVRYIGGNADRKFVEELEADVSTGT